MKRVYLCLFFLLVLSNVFSQRKGILDHSASPHVSFKSTPIGACKWTTGFWADKFKICEETMVPYMGSLLCGDTGHALNNFKIAAGLKEGEHQGMRWHDGDFYKWIEAAMYIYAQNNNQKLLKEIDNYIEIIGKAQQADGYLQTQAKLRDDITRYSNRRNHEMYNSGHLFTSACIHHRITGQKNFLNIAIKQADLLYEVFYPENKAYARFGFNQTQIMGLVELYRTTQEKKYLQLAEKFINRRGTFPVEHNHTTQGYPIGDMVQERTPIRESEEAVGHAVLALYYYAGAADVFAETGEKALLDALERLWSNVTEQKMYVTGAVGQAHYGVAASRDKIQEGFIDAYMMPNMTAYNETCANVCNAMFSYRMLGINGEAKYADVMELVLYNSALSGISLEGKDYFYANPLRMIHNARDFSAKRDVTESTERQPYLNCFCCPPNLVRTIAKVSEWAYSTTNNGIAVNLYGGNKLDTKLTDGSHLKITQETNYPWEGTINITIDQCKSTPFDFKIRIPQWAEGTTLLVNGKETNIEIIPGTYTTLNQSWKAGDLISINMPMDIQLVEGHPRIEEVRNQVAVKRGPVVYCVETPDLPEGTEITNVYVKAEDHPKAVYQPDLLGGITTINTNLLLRTDQKEGMYRTVKQPIFKSYPSQLIPYYAWSNRGKAEMTVFIPVVW